jgi:gas vesicle protein
MADGYDQFDKNLDYHEGGGSSFVIGLLTGTVLGAGLGMLFAPKAGSELRRDLSEQAGNLSNKASEGYRRASESAGQWAERGRDIYNRASEAVAKGADEARRYAGNMSSEPTSGGTGSESPYSGPPGSSSSFGSSTYGRSEKIRGGSTE